jgi:hypothetical protein
MHTDNPTLAPKTNHATAQPAPISGKAFLFKTCRACGQEKPLRAFYKQYGCRERHRLDCILCVKARTNAARAVRDARKARESRRCPKCHETLPITDFLEDDRCRAGHRRDCKRCEARRDEKREGDPRRAALNLPDKLIPRYSALREERIDLGIAIAHATCPPGQCRTREEIAAYTGLTLEAVRRIEVRALWKMRLRARKALEALGLEDYVKEGVPQ